MRTTWKSLLSAGLAPAVLVAASLAPVAAGCGSAGVDAEFAPGSEADASADASDEQGDGATAATCGDGIVQGTEACDDGNQVDDDACHVDCTLSCGDGKLQPGEACDPGIESGAGACPKACPNAPECQVGSVQGSACQATCVYEPVATCQDGDGCCGFGCDAQNDADCHATCGNMTVEPGETCDPPGSCPTSCNDGVACTADTATGAPATCDVVCVNTLITTCANGDGCCPSGCDGTTDDDCASSCGNGVVEAAETCDPPSSCPASCVDGDPCTDDTPSGSAAACNFACPHTPITTLTSGDGCCPAGANANTDADCSSVCGNGAVESGETCDTGIGSGAGACPASCDDGVACTENVQTGSGCTLACSNPPITACVAGDGCCPSGCNGATDADCAAVCGNGVLESGESCDTGIASGAGACPASCDDGVACTSDALVGTACARHCVNAPISACVGGDGCCPTGCTNASDADCAAVCGNGVVEAGETCDKAIGSDAGACPATCDDGVACTKDTATGATASCDLACSHASITACATPKDGCCPSGCNATNDGDCSASCGNGVVEAGETCDPPSSCPTSCGDGNACTTDTLTGSAANCSAACAHTPITTCATTKDGCCPGGCNASSDGDCAPVCGNGVVESGETCDGNCPSAASCNDGIACTADALTGSAGSCTAACTHAAITACASGDGCCPSGCNANTDSDCTPVCGNGVLESGETCDPVATCPSSCSDNDACTTDTATGSAASCTASCSHTSITACAATKDGCCPAGCNANTDGDCAPVCGNGVVEGGETCDGNCPTAASCNDGIACTTDAITGSGCTAACTHATITACSATSDGCCPAGCTGANDADCTGSVSPGSLVTAGACLTATTTAKTAVVVTLVDTANKPLTGATVTMSTTAGTLGAVSSTANTYWATLQAPATASATSATVTVVANGVTLTTKPVVTIAAPFPTTDTQGGAAGCSVQGNVRVRVLDAAGSAVAGANVMIGAAPQATAYATTFGAAASAPNTATTDANGYAQFLDFDGALTGAQTITVGAASYDYVTFASLDAADVVIPIELVAPTVSKGRTTGAFNPLPSGWNTSAAEFGMALPDLAIDDLATFSLSGLLGKSDCYTYSSITGSSSTALPSNIFIPNQASFLATLPTHNYTSPYMKYGSRKVSGLFGNAPLLALSGGITAALPQITLSAAGVVDLNLGAAGPQAQDIPINVTDVKDVACNASGLPAVSDVFCITAVDFDSAASATLGPGDGRIGLTGFKTTTLGAGATAANITGTARVPITATNAYKGSEYLGAVAALYLDATRSGIPAGTSAGSTAILKRSAPFSTANGGTMTVNDFLPIRVLAQSGRSATLSSASAGSSPAPSFVVHTFTQDVSTPYTACSSNDSTSKSSYVLWRVYTPGSASSFTLPTLPASWPRASAAGNYSGLVDPTATPEIDVVSWEAMTLYEGLRATAVNYNQIRLSEYRPNVTHVSSNSADWQ